MQKSITQPTQPYSAAALDPYLVKLRKGCHTGLSADSVEAIAKKRDEVNAAILASNVGATYPHQHDAVRRIADEFGLNRQQPLAFFIFGAAWIGRGAVPTADSLRLHVSGGAGSGKSYVLKAIKALVDCPALSGVVRPGGLLTVAFQGKQAASVGGATVHSVADVPRGDKSKDGLLDNTDGQSTLDEGKAARWRNKEVLAIEKVSMVPCKLMGYLQKSAASVRPSWASLPYAGMICVTFGDLDQVILSCNGVCLRNFDTLPTVSNLTLAHRLYNFFASLPSHTYVRPFLLFAGSWNLFLKNQLCSALPTRPS